MNKTTALWAQAMVSVTKTYNLPRPELDHLVHKKLHKVLLAAKETPYYRDVMRRLDYDPATDFQGPNDLKLFPVLTKDILKEYGEKAFIRDKTDISQHFCDSTSGSTGIPLKIYRDPEARAVQLAKWLRVFFTNGFSVFDKTLSFTSQDRLQEGRSILQKFGLFRRHPVDFLLPQETMVDEILAYQPTVLYGNRSSLDLVSDELERRGGTYPLKLLIGGSEVITDQHRRRYEQCFATRLIEYYGSVELGILAFETPDNDGMTLCEDQSYFEFFDNDGEPAKAGDEARIIVTDLSNTLMPFIRYDQGDKVFYQNSGTNKSNDWRRLERVIGRDNDIVTLTNGKKLQGRFFYNLLSHYQGIYRFRAVQKSLNKFEIYIQANSDYVRSIEHELIKFLQEKTDHGCDFLIIQCDQLHPEKNGKFRTLISEIQ